LKIVRRELLNRIIGMLRRLKRFGYICCDITLSFLVDSAVPDLFCKLCLSWQTVHHSLAAVQKCNNLTDHGHPYELSRFVAAEQIWPNPVDYKMSTRQKRRMW